MIIAFIKKVILYFVVGVIALGIIGSFLPEVKKEVVKVEKPIVKEVVKVEKPIVKKNTLKGGYGACVSADLFDQFTTVAVNNDQNGINYLLKNGCFITTKGIEFSLLDRSFTGTAKIRVYKGNETIILWTNNENLNL